MIIEESNKGPHFDNFSKKIKIYHLGFFFLLPAPKLVPNLSINH
jgi:hypothetical protein